jgi:hypothetical protein
MIWKEKAVSYLNYFYYSGDKGKAQKLRLISNRNDIQTVHLPDKIT